MAPGFFYSKSRLNIDILSIKIQNHLKTIQEPLKNLQEPP